MVLRQGHILTEIVKKNVRKNVKNCIYIDENPYKKENVKKGQKRTLGICTYEYPGKNALFARMARGRCGVPTQGLNDAGRSLYQGKSGH